MYRGCRRLVCSLVCVFSILCMLFLDTCIVEAGNNVYSSSISGNFNISADSTWFSYNTTATNLVYPNAYYITGGQHFDVPFTIKAPISYFTNLTIGQDRYYTMNLSSISTSFSGIDVSNLGIKNSEGTLIWSQNNGTTYTPAQYYSYYNATDLQRQYFVFSGYLSFDATFTSGKNGSDGTQTVTGYYSFNCNYMVADSTEEYVALNTANYVTDVALNNSVNTIKEDTETTAENTSSILTSITDFFGSFFSNLIGVFVPEDGYFSTWFDKVNTLLSDKLGMLYAPFDLVISTLQAIYSSSTTESGIPFPGIKWEDTWLVEPFTFTFASLGSNFDDLRDKVYFATDTVLVLTFLMLLQSKVKLILEGHE